MKTFFECHIDSCFCIFEIVIDRLLFGESSTILDIIKHKIAELDFPNLILDMNRVKTLDSSGIGLLISVKRLVDAHKKKLIIINDDQKILKLLNNTGLENYFQVFHKLDDATSYFLNNEKANI
jgi:anti-anti-sigma factor